MNRTLCKTIVLVGIVFHYCTALAQDGPGPVVPNLEISPSERLKVFNAAWETVNKHFFDPKFNGVNWAQVKEKYKPLVEAATDRSQLRAVLYGMVGELHASHMGISGFSPGVSYNYGLDLIQVEGKSLVRAPGQDSIAQRAGVGRGWILLSAQGDCVSAERKVSVRMLDLQEQTQNLELLCGSHTFPPESTIVQVLESGAVYLRFTKFQPEPGNGWRRRWLPTCRHPR